MRSYVVRYLLVVTFITLLFGFATSAPTVEPEHDNLIKLISQIKNCTLPVRVNGSDEFLQDVSKICAQHQKEKSVLVLCNAALKTFIDITNCSIANAINGDAIKPFIVIPRKDRPSQQVCADFKNVSSSINFTSEDSTEMLKRLSDDVTCAAFCEKSLPVCEFLLWSFRTKRLIAAHIKITDNSDSQDQSSTTLRVTVVTGQGHKANVPNTNPNSKNDESGKDKEPPTTKENGIKADPKSPGAKTSDDDTSSQLDAKANKNSDSENLINETPDKDLNLDFGKTYENSVHELHTVVNDQPSPDDLNSKTHNTLPDVSSENDASKKQIETVEEHGMVRNEQNTVDSEILNSHSDVEKDKTPGQITKSDVKTTEDKNKEVKPGVTKVAITHSSMPEIFNTKDETDLLAISKSENGETRDPSSDDDVNSKSVTPPKQPEPVIKGDSANKRLAGGGEASSESTISQPDAKDDKKSSHEQPMTTSVEKTDENADKILKPGIAKSTISGASKLTTPNVDNEGSELSNPESQNIDGLQDSETDTDYAGAYDDDNLAQPPVEQLKDEVSEDKEEKPPSKEKAVSQSGEEEAEKLPDNSKSPDHGLEDGINQPRNLVIKEPEDSHFFFYFLSLMVVCIVGYLVFHNKQKIIALIIEGRHERRRRPQSGSYKRLDTKEGGKGALPIF